MFCFSAFLCSFSLTLVFPYSFHHMFIFTCDWNSQTSALLVLDVFGIRCACSVKNISFRFIFYTRVIFRNAAFAAKINFRRNTYISYNRFSIFRQEVWDYHTIIVSWCWLLRNIQSCCVAMISGTVLMVQWDRQWMLNTLKEVLIFCTRYHLRNDSLLIVIKCYAVHLI